MSYSEAKARYAKLGVDADAAIEKLKETVKGNDTEAIKADTEALQQAFYPLAEKLYRDAQAAGGAAPEGDGVYNADFEDKTDN